MHSSLDKLEEAATRGSSAANRKDPCELWCMICSACVDQFSAIPPVLQAISGLFKVYRQSWFDLEAGSWRVVGAVPRFGLQAHTCRPTSGQAANASPANSGAGWTSGIDERTNSGLHWKIANTGPDVCCGFGLSLLLLRMYYVLSSRRLLDSLLMCN